MFYVEGIKVVPQEIYHLLSPVALAHWISCDGAGIKQGGLLLCTDGFTVPEVCKLMNVLMIRYGLNCTLQYYAGLPRIYIPAKDLRTTTTDRGALYAPIFKIQVISW